MAKTVFPDGKFMAAVKVGPKGQIVIPAEVRELFGIAPGDTLLLLADRVGITLANVSVLKNGKAKALKISTLVKLCEALDCQPGDILEYRRSE